MKLYKIYLLEDDQNFGSVLKSYLEINDFEVIWEDSGRYAIQSFKKHSFDICILDVMLPHIDGFTIAGQIKEINDKIPFIFLTAKSLKEDMIKGFKTGAEDYIIKPFDSEVLLYKIRAILNRNNLNSEKIISDEFNIGMYIFRKKIRTIEINSEEIKLSPKESQLLEMLCVHINDVLPRQYALKTIWKEESYFTTRSMDVYITKLRKYLQKDSNIEIVNIHGSGYSLKITE